MRRGLRRAVHPALDQRRPAPYRRRASATRAGGGPPPGRYAEEQRHAGGVRRVEHQDLATAETVSARSRHGVADFEGRTATRGHGAASRWRLRPAVRRRRTPARARRRPAACRRNQRVTTATTSPTSRPGQHLESIGALAVPAGSLSSEDHGLGLRRVDRGRTPSSGVARPSSCSRSRSTTARTPRPRPSPACRGTGPLDLDLRGPVPGQGQVGRGHSRYTQDVAADPDDERRDDHDEEHPDEPRAADTAARAPT